MFDLKKKLESLGLLHDSVVNELVWKPEERTVVIAIDDFYSNFQGLPEYPGLVPGTLILRRVQSVSVEIDFEEPSLNIYELSAEQGSQGGYLITVLFRPSGRMRIACGLVELPDLGNSSKLA